MAHWNRLTGRTVLICSTLSLALTGNTQQIPVLQTPLDLFIRNFLPEQQPVSPKEPLFIGLDGKPLQIPTFSSKANTRPELAQLPVPKPAQTSNQALGNQGVKIGQQVVEPFGSKGEKVGIAFGSGFFVPPANEKIQPTLRRLALSRVDGDNVQADNASPQDVPAVYALLLLNGRMMPEIETKLKNMGVVLYAPYPETAWQARIPAGALDAVAALPEVRWIGQPTSIQKMHPDLWRASVAGLNQAVGEMQLYVALFGPDAHGTIQDDIRVAGGNVKLYDAGIKVVQVDATPAMLSKLAALDSVLYMEPILRSEKHDTQSMSSINADWLWGNFAPSNTNKVKVGILDTGTYIYHTDFANVIGGTTGYSLISGENCFEDLNTHGTHVAGTFFGEGRGQGRYRGVAANLTQRNDSSNPDFVIAQVLASNGFSSGNSVLQGLQGVNGEFHAALKVQVFNASLGSTGTNLVGTDTNSRKVDELMRNNVLPVLSAGNSGPGAGTIGSPGVAKNALTVGSINDNYGPSGFVGWPGNNDDIATYSSRGPTGDSRTKPDVVAPGSWIDSVRSRTSGSYLYDWTGTSMASPHVAGLAAGIIGHYNMPAWATKAAVIASAYDTGLGRDNAGWGKVDAMMAHYGIDGYWNGWWWDNGTTGDTRYIDFTLPAHASRVRIALVWPDADAAAGATVSRVNDLDLGLQWGTLTTDWSRNLSSTSANQTVEVIDANNLGAGTYRLKVHSYNVSSAQSWAVVVKVIYGSLSPNIAMNLDTPYAVQPNTSFYAKATSTAGSHVASSVYGSIALASGLSLDGLWYNRRGNPSSGDEWVWFPNPRDTAIGYYNPYGMNHGSIAAGYSRTFWWQPRSGSTEGTRAVTYSVSSRNGGSGSVSRNVIVDGTPAVPDGPYFWYWSGLSATTYCWFQDPLAGLNVGSGYYMYSNDGGATWSSWISTPCTGANTTTLSQYAYAVDVPFGQNSIALNRIWYAIADMAGNWSYSSVGAVWTPANLGGALTLEGPASMAQPLTFEFRPLDGGSVFTRTVTPDASGNYTITSLEPRTYEVHIKGSKWLAVNVALDLIHGDTTLASTYLRAGDANDDNSVDVLDLSDLITAFDATPSDGNWNAGADFNCDDSVDVLDLALLIENFDSSGDP